MAFVAGFGIALFIEILGRSLSAMNVHPGMWLSSAVMCVWPMSVALIETSKNWMAYIAFFAAALGNGLLYALVAALVYYCFRLVKDGEFKV